MFVLDANPSHYVCCRCSHDILKRKHVPAELAPFNRILKRDQALIISSMKVKTIEIAWHRRPEANHNDPVLSVDFLNETVFATGGGDHEVKVRIR